MLRGKEFKSFPVKPGKLGASRIQSGEFSSILASELDRLENGAGFCMVTLATPWVKKKWVVFSCPFGQLTSRMGRDALSGSPDKGLFFVPACRIRTLSKVSFWLLFFYINI